MLLPGRSEATHSLAMGGHQPPVVRLFKIGTFRPTPWSELPHGECGGASGKQKLPVGAGAAGPAREPRSGRLCLQRAGGNVPSLPTRLESLRELDATRLLHRYAERY